MLPIFIYGTVGAVTIANNEIALGRLSGALLLSAAAVNHTMRRIYRSK